ncbi:isochorismate synthase [Lacisediminihabitans profunda]|uniref:isochorismate synthase n=1 Tax=Lacisediminihabitans profunda TaxID=2594790 RepID=A0A5C8UWE7_9MICO|nr:isochorismate synthase [Lacisediminihabitans profunda]TXN32373.1 isochorismate synthase [Lacisediminihabitans profunda]
MTGSEPSSVEPPVPALVVETVETDDPGPLVPLLDRGNPLLWTRRGYGLVGHGEALRLEFTGKRRMLDAAEAWQRVVAAATVNDPLSRTGTGLIAMGSFAFSDRSRRTSVLIVPSIVIGRDTDRSWVTRIGVGALPDPVVPPMQPYGGPFTVALRPGTLDADGYRAAVAAAVDRICNRDLSKVVIARELVGSMPPGADLRRAIEALALGYRDCWTFSIDGFFGSSPETLVSVDDGSVSARVLAGSAARGSDERSDEDAATALATSPKDQDEHQFAVQNVLASLRSHSPNVTASEMPFTLKLPNLWHLASDVEGELTDGSTSLDLISALHPTAAVAGTPTAEALRLIEELEPFDRGRFAGPVGWVGADGDGEWAVALRSAQVDPDGTVTAYAGAGIVAGSVPERELVETRLKFRPIVEALA